MSDLNSSNDSQITIRVAGEGDLRQVARLAGRDSATVPPGRLLVAAIGEEVRAAVSLSDGSVIADPFHRTAELVEMLRIRASAANGAQAHQRVALLRRAARTGLAFRSAA